MNQIMSLTQPQVEESLFRRWWNGRSFLEKRLIRLCLSLLVMVVCFPLYDMGLFGTVDGPLNPAHFGDRLASLGVTRTHSQIFFLSLLIIALSWNWIFNLVSLALGSRLTCIKPTGDGAVCGEPARRIKVTHKRTGQEVERYVCAQGHKLSEAHFRRVEKGTVGHTLWVICLLFCVIVYFLS